MALVVNRLQPSSLSFRHRNSLIAAIVMAPRKSWNRCCPRLAVYAKPKRPQLIPSLLLCLTVLLFLRAPWIHPPSHTVVTDYDVRVSNSTLPPLRVVVICSPRTTLSSLKATLDSIPDNPVTLHHFGSTLNLNNSRLSVDQVIHSSRRPYEDPLRTLHPPALYLRAGSVLSPLAIPWLKAARDTYAHRTDIAAFSLTSTIPRVKTSGPDHLPTSWRRINVRGPFAYGLLEVGDGFFPNIGKDLAVWETFSEWLLLRRSDWYKYPEGDGVDGTPLGISELAESSWTSGDWHVWFSKFLAEYRLRVIYSGIPGLIASEGKGGLYSGSGDFKMGDMEAYHANGEAVKGGMYKPETVKQIVDFGKQHGGMVSFTLMNKIFLDTARSWLCNVDVANMRPRGLLWAVTDRESAEEMRRIEGSEVVMLDEVRGGKETGHDFGNPGYWRLMLERTALIGELLRQGVALFAFETDAIWLEDPQPYIDELVSQDADIVGTINSRQEVSGNFFYLRPTLATRRMWDEITERFEDAYNAQSWYRKRADSWTYIENDQSVLTKLILRNETWRRSYPLTFLTLDMELFVDGRWYKPNEGFYTSKRAREPVVVNNNFAIGMKEKTDRAKKHGHWFWDEDEKKCLVDAVRKAVRRNWKR